MGINERINTLNPMQKKAVLTTEGPLLLLAGAGSGKTRVLTHRIAYLIENGVRPFNILAITFTNKAAKEMKERVAAITEKGDEVWVSTFHSTCVRILRREIDKIGYNNHFSIYDADDSERLVKNILKEMNVSEQYYKPKAVAAIIGEQKDNLITPEQYMASVENDFRLKKVAEIYQIYQNRLYDNNALDFDDLIFKTVELFKKRSDILEKYQDRFRYIMVDEYQDTNTSQYQLIRLLAQKYRNLCVVGDDDQSIYGWRGANINNILDFEKDFDNTTVIKLEQNYRSTDTILDAANYVIKNNFTRKPKTLWTNQKGGEKITHFTAESDYAEARYIAKIISDGAINGKEYKDYAVLYRNNALSRIIEEALIKDGIPYRLFGGIRFYDRKEIKDVMGYLKVIYNPDDDIAIRRIINVPKRGIGDTTIGKIAEYAAQNGMSFYMALLGCENIESISSRAKKSLKKFAVLLNDLRVDSEVMSVSEILEKIIEDTGYISDLEAEKTDEANGRIENIQELISKATEFEESNPEDSSLSAFLEEVALVADIDNFTENDDTVVLMTLHSSKGLEFDTVFIAGFEENVFPGFRACQDNTMKEMEEERRLCYVGITRAKNHLYLTSAKSRLQFGQRRYNLVSRFLKEIPKEFIDSKTENVSVRNNTEDKYKIPKFKTQRIGAFKMPEPKNVSLDFEIGDKVKHFKFGIGTVTDMRSAGPDYEVTVDFDNLGVKKLMAKLAKLKKI